MNTANSGAVFFLGTRAHYQVLTPPESHVYDLENGNASTETIYQNPSTDLWHKTEDTENYNDICNTDNGSPKELDSDAVKRRLKKNRKQDGSSELILNDNDDCHDTKEDEISVDCKAKQKRGRVSVAQLLSLLARRRRTLRGDRCARLALGVCTFRDSCRCDDCQSRYFECDESDDDHSISDDSDYSQQYSQQYSQPYAASVNTYADEPAALEDTQPIDEEDDDDDEDDDEVFINMPPADTASTDLLLTPAPRPAPPAAPTDDEKIMALELAAGAPLFFDHLLNHPITCAIQ